MAKGKLRNEYLALHKLLRELRVEAELAQVDVAKKIGKPQQYVSRYESGERRLDLIELRQVCRALGMGLSELVERFEDALGRG